MLNLYALSNRLVLERAQYKFNKLLLLIYTEIQLTYRLVQSKSKYHIKNTLAYQIQDTQSINQKNLYSTKINKIVKGAQDSYMELIHNALVVQDNFQAVSGKYEY